jgi:3-carboxy-cis,cis-muconate cycloisomerase
MVEVAEGLSVNSEKMRANVDATRGTIFAEKAMIMLGKERGRDAAHKLLEETTRKSVAESRHLSEVLRDTPEIAVRLDADALRDLENPEKYLGVADEFRKRLLSAKSKNPESERE